MTERTPIRVMPPDLALKIAAGEVVERPASAVRELLDNALDAGATQIRIEVQEAGLKSIRVTDNGCGIPRDEVPLAFQSHATSKIRTLEDLEHLQSLGFRGEALPSIAAVSRVEVQTRTADESVGTRFAVDYGDPGTPAPAASPVGLRIAVLGLFGNVPARRAFVRSLRAETGQIGGVVMRCALAHPEVAFILTVDGRTTLATPGGRLEDAVAEVMGSDIVALLLPIASDERGIGVTGLIGVPALTRPNRSSVHVFVNGRPVTNRSLVFALEEAYSGYLMTGRHPAAIVHLWLPPAEVDANIHPSKSEVRFAREREVHGSLHRAVQSALLEHRLRERGIPPEDGASAMSPDTLDEMAETQAALPLQVPPLPEDEGAIPVEHALPALRVFGQANATFIIAEGPNGLYMIDQHAAHERILFDRFDAALGEGSVQSQPLLEPASVDLTPAQMLALEENGTLLRSAGFALEPFGTAACLVRAIPALPGNTSPVDLVGEVLTELENLPEPAAARERALAAMACKAAVKAGATLDVQEMRELVAQLERTPRPATCPHGRPTMIHLSHTQMEREFGRR